MAVSVDSQANDRYPNIVRSRDVLFVVRAGRLLLENIIEQGILGAWVFSVSPTSFHTRPVWHRPLESFIMHIYLMRRLFSKEFFPQFSRQMHQRLRDSQKISFCRLILPRSWPAMNVYSAASDSSHIDSYGAKCFHSLGTIQEGADLTDSAAIN